MRIFKAIVGLVETNCYIIYEPGIKEAIIIDPGSRSDNLDDAIDKLSLNGFNFKYILLTHGHFDHIGAAAYYSNKTGAKILMHKDDEKFILDGSLNLGYGVKQAKVEPFKPYRLLEDNDKIDAVGEEFKVLATPGHTRGSCCYLVKNIIFTGDTLMRSSVGRTDFPTGSTSSLIKSIKRLKGLEGNYKIYPGHMEATDLDYERSNNYYFSIY